jgi:predicted nucleic acid-binding protein
LTGFLLDTNVISELVKPRPDAGVTGWIESVEETLLYLSVLTLGEMRKGIAGLRSGRRRADLEAWLEGSLRARFSGRTLPVNDAVADRWGQIMAVADARGARMPVIDGLFAATALHHNLTLVTRNVADVEASGASVFNPWTSTRRR